MFTLIAFGCFNENENPVPDIKNAVKEEEIAIIEESEVPGMIIGNNNVEKKKAATREYFENLDKESTLEAIVDEIGNYGIEGSGIIYHVWKLDDGAKAKVVFDSKGRIVMIYIVDENNSERIYKREY